MPKFFVEQKQIENDRITIVGNDAAHISYALRMAKGEHICVCDGHGKEYDCVLSEFFFDCVVASVVSARDCLNESPIRVYLYQALPKGDKLETVIQKSVECGVFEITPFESERCIVKVKAEAEEKKTSRRNRIAEEAAKQSGRGYVPLVLQTVSFEQAIAQASQADLALICYEDEIGTTLKQALQDGQERHIGSVSVLIGSEGGFSPNEVERAKKAGCLPISLGKRILRTETAPVFVLSNICYQFEL